MWRQEIEVIPEVWGEKKMKANLTAEQLDRCQRKEKKIYKVRNGIPHRQSKGRQRQRGGGWEGRMCMKTNSTPVKIILTQSSKITVYFSFCG